MRWGDTRTRRFKGDNAPCPRRRIDSGIVMTVRSRDETRRALLDAALDQFGIYGFQRTSHADLAADVGIGRTTFYEYFSSTEDLVVQLVEERLPEMTDELIRSVPDTLDPGARLAEMVSRMITYVGTDHLGLILHSEVPRLSNQAQLRVAKAHTQLSKAFDSTYRAGVEAGDFRTLPGRLAGRLILEVIMTAGREVMNTPDAKQHVHEIADSAVEFLLAGLRAVRNSRT